MRTMAWPGLCALQRQTSPGPRGLPRASPPIHSLCLLGVEGSSVFSVAVSPSSAILLAKLLDTYSLLVSSAALLKGDMAEYTLV